MQPRLRSFVFACAVVLLALVAGSCGSDPVDTGIQPDSDTTTATSSSSVPLTSEDTTTSDGEPRLVITVDDLFDGEGPRRAIVAGAVVWDSSSARLCAALMESFPAQCGQPSVVIANPDGLDAVFDEEQGVRWTASPVEIDVFFDGDRIVLDEGESVEPTEDEVSMADAFVTFSSSPSSDTAAALPWADSVALGVSNDIYKTVESTLLADPATWQIDLEEYAGFSGPFSALDLEATSIMVTVGAHNRCAGPPVPAPEGFADSRRISLQPTDVDSCITWWTIDFFLDTDSRIEAITLDLFGP